MARQPKKMLKRDLSYAMWNGQLCDVVREQLIVKSDNVPLKCLVIRIHGLELWKALRLVAADEVSGYA